MRNTFADYLKRRTDGTTAVEFAILAPCFLGLVIGTIYTGMMLLTAGSMYNAVQDASRCAAVKTTVCTNSGTITYAQGRYFGPGTTPTFTYATPACGKKVTATTTFVFDFIIRQVSVPLSATACHP